MKTGNKILLWCLCIVAVVVISVTGTLAYLTDRDSAVNTFTVGQVDITLDEAKVNTDGTPVKGAERVQENEYHLIPGQTYTKDPMITVKAGSAKSYVRMMVTLNNADKLLEIFGEEFLPENYVEGWDSSIWECVKVGKIAEDNTITYEFRYYQTVTAAEDKTLEPLFTELIVPQTMTGEQLKNLNDPGKFTITVHGHAIQAAGFENADEAWAAFEKQMNP